MKQRIEIIVLLLFVLFQATSSVAQIQKASGKVFRVENRTYISQNDKLYEIDEKVVLAKLRKGKVLSNTELGKARNIAMDNYALSVPDSVDVEKYVMMLEKTGRFEFVEYNLIYSPCVTANDAYYYYQWHLSAINANAAWEITTGTPTVRVAVIDDGVELNHEDLYYGNDSYANLNVGYCVDYVSSTDHTPETSHGTMVAGVIGAKTNNNYVGVAGIAGGYGCSGSTIISFRTDYSASQIASAIYNAIMNKGVKVINLSIGGGYSSVVSNALDYAYNNGVTVVCSSGNDSSSSISFPASHQYTIAVGSTNQSNEVASDSNYGSGLDLVAPGVGIWTTCKNAEGKYKAASGTSLAAPQVTGVVALMLSVNPNLSPSQIKNKIINTCTKLSGYEYVSGWESHVGYGLLNAFAAVVAALDLEIEGPHLIATSGTYYIDNLPSGFTVEWSLSNSYYNNGYNLLIQNYPTTGHCLIIRDNNHDLTNDTLTATIKYNGETIRTLTKTGIYAYSGFWGQYSSGNLSGNINYTCFFNIKANNFTTIFSPNFYDATVSYSSSGAIPSSWSHNPNTGVVSFYTTNTSAPVIINVHDCCGNDYVLYAYPSSLYSINASNGVNGITVTLVEEGNASKDFTPDQSWTIEVRSAATGELMTTLSSISRSETISTVGWPKGVYIIKVTIGKEELTEKVIVK